VYRLAGGPHVIGTRADALIAYNLSMGFTLPVIPPDSYEPNDLVSQASSSSHRSFYTRVAHWWEESWSSRRRA
jgi:hypothetical protein